MRFNPSIIVYEAEDMEKLGRIKILDGTVLKLIAMVSMIFDHVGDNFFPDRVWMRVI